VCGDLHRVKLYSHESKALLFTARNVNVKGKGKVTPKQAYVALRGPGG
jgi:hypothetical protein